MYITGTFLLTRSQYQDLVFSLRSISIHRFSRSINRKTYSPRGGLGFASPMLNTRGDVPTMLETCLERVKRHTGIQRGFCSALPPPRPYLSSLPLSLNPILVSIVLQILACTCTSTLSRTSFSNYATILQCRISVCICVCTGTILRILCVREIHPTISEYIRALFLHFVYLCPAVMRHRAQYMSLPFFNFKPQYGKEKTIICAV